MATDQITFTDPNGETYDLTLTVVSSANDGTGTITNITGTVDGQPVIGLDTTGLGDAAGADNLITSTAFPQIDENGISFDTANDAYVVYSDFSGNIDIYDQLAANFEGGVAGTVTGYTFEELCYLRGTRILTPTGEKPIEALNIGDLVVTRFGGLQKIRWIGRQSFDTRFASRNPAKMPVCVKAGALGDRLPARDLFISPGHSMLVGENLLLASTLVNGTTITRAVKNIGEVIEYFQIDLGVHDCVIAEGTWSESFADGPGLREQYHNFAEFLELFPEYIAPEELSLCAKRPERGARLEAALRPIVARASETVVPGALEGCVDNVIGQRRIEGWAMDAAHPELPVLLDIAVHGTRIGTVLACEFRPDLLEAGKGFGRCAFYFTAPKKLDAEDVRGLTVSRAADGALLAGPITDEALAGEVEMRTLLVA